MGEKMSGPAVNLNVVVTHVDDSARGREGPYVYLWGKYVENNSCIDECVENIRNILEHRPPPSLRNLQVGQICCVFVNQQWHRACIKQLEPDTDQKFKVQLVDSGASYCVPLSSLRTLDISGKVVKHIREYQPIAFKFVLADIVAPRHGQWSEKAISFLKSEVLDQNWTANLLGYYKECQVVRLFHPCHHYPLATSMIQQEFGVPSATYQGALPPTQWIDHTPASQKPARDLSSFVYNVPNERRDRGHLFAYTRSVVQLIPAQTSNPVN